VRRAFLRPAWSCALLLCGCVSIELPLAGRGALEESVVDGESGPKILMLEVSGTLTTRPESGTFGLGGRESPTARMREEIERALEDDEIVALLLRIDSPGGSVIASEMLYREVHRFKRESKLPVVAQMIGAGTSGAYYVAMAADEVRAYPSTVTGSIGVIIPGLNLSGLMERFGVANQTITTGAFKDAGSPLRPMLPEERAQLEGVARDLFASFLDVVQAGRPKLARERIEQLADGRVYSASQALEAGLIDAIGDLPEAVEATKRAAQVEGDARVVVYHRPGERPENMFWARTLVRPAAAALEREASAEGAFLYLWTPGAGLPPLQ
jgi:protease-4